MKIKPRALMIGAGVAAAMLILVAICNQTVNYLTFDPTLTFDPNADPTEVLANSSITLLLSVLSCIILLVAYTAGGYLYSHFHANEDPMLQIQDGVVGGAITGAVAGIIYGLISACMSLIVTQFLLADQIAEMTAQLGDVPGMGALLGATAGAGGAGAICCGLVMGLVLGAIGGAIGASVRGRK